ncbi:MAG: prepilin peptidase [Myxococcota bacterium]
MTIEIVPGAWLPVAAILGLLVGSFLNVVIHRVPAGLSIVFCVTCRPASRRRSRPGTRCPSLYLWLRRRCRHCGVRISARYPAVEA